MLGHGAGGGVDAPDLLAARSAARDAGWAVARVLQPYRRAGRRAPAPAAQLDAAWVAVAAALRDRPAISDVALVAGGRSSGARVACRTAQPLAARSVLALGFPLHPPGRPERSRSGELASAAVRVIVVQGDRDAFGSARDISALGYAHVDVHEAVGADHALRSAEARRVVAHAVAVALTAT
jgi:predicted alpha/beta-hydrolase family hydrolase